MARTRKRAQDETIPVSVFRDIHIHFPGDVYTLALWVAMSDRAKSTPTLQGHTTLHGLADKFVSAYGVSYSKPLSSAEVMAIFHEHGITGNPELVLDSNVEASEAISIMESG